MDIEKQRASYIDKKAKELLEYGFSNPVINKFKKLSQKEFEITDRPLTNKKGYFDNKLLLKRQRDLGTSQFKKFELLINNFPENAKKPKEFIEFYLDDIEKSERPKGLFSILTNKKIKLTDKEYWEMIISTWTMTEAQTYSVDRKFWAYMLTMFKPINEFKGTLKQVPNKFTAYRGGHIGGFSYTTNKEKALWFKNRWGDDTPLLQRETLREEVLFFTNDRQEFEVVLMPSCVAKKNREIE